MTALAAARDLALTGARVRFSPLPATSQRSELRLLTCGSVDDGKSTLIGRLLWDATGLSEDQRAMVLGARSRTDSSYPDFSLLVDGLQAEREQGITIDIAWRYFDTEARRFVVIDSPGHEQYTRNMASGASHADAAILLVDARHGVKTQTRRHAAILNLAGIKRVLLAVNKMDLVGWSETRFREIAADFARLTERFGFLEAEALPVAALPGDNVAVRSRQMAWYEGPTLLEVLEGLPSRDQVLAGPFRFPVQTVVRDGRDFRGLAGTVTAGVIHVGDDVAEASSGRRARVKRLVTMNGDLPRAVQGQAVVVQLDRDLDIARGAVLASPATPPVLARTIEARLVWLADVPFDARAGYLLRSATDLAPLSSFEIASRLDLETLETEAVDTCRANDIVLARLGLARPVAFDDFASLPETGSFLVIDAVSGATVAGGVVLDASAERGQDAAGTFVLTRELLERGLCSDLGRGRASEREFRRRANEVALILRAAGVPVRVAEEPAGAKARP